jgi:hypothetical protein
MTNLGAKQVTRTLTIEFSDRTQRLRALGLTMHSINPHQSGVNNMKDKLKEYCAPYHPADIPLCIGALAVLVFVLLTGGVQ